MREYLKKAEPRAAGSDAQVQTVVAEILAQDLASWLPIAETIVESLRFDA